MPKAKQILDLIKQVIADGSKPESATETRVQSTNAVTKKLGITARTVRFYSEVGIATPMRRGSTGLFTPSQVRRLELARELRGLGMDVKTVSAVLDQLTSPEPMQDKLPALTELFSTHTKELLHQEEEVRRQYFVTTNLVKQLFSAATSN